MDIKLPHDHGQDIIDVLGKMPNQDVFDEVSDVFKQLSDASRLKILYLLCHCEECGVNIAAALSMSTAAVSHHLKSLKMQKLITSRRSGKEVYYTLAKNKTAKLVHESLDDLLHIICPI